MSRQPSPKSASMPLAQSLAIESQIRLPGSVGRILKQIRDIESVAPLFRDAGLVKSVSRPAVIDLSVAGVATRSTIKRALGGFVYACAGARVDLLIRHNQVSTRGGDSVAELDDIDFEAHRKRLELIEMRQGYRLAERQLTEPDPARLILLDTPLFLDRQMAPLERHQRHAQEYEQTRAQIATFWEQHRARLFPWNPQGPILASIVAERFTAIVSMARGNLRTQEGRRELLASDGYAAECIDHIERLARLDERLAGIGDQRFVNGILGSFNRTMAFRLTEARKRLEPKAAAASGVLGFHYRGGRGSSIQMVQLPGDEPDWDSAHLDAVAWRLMVLDMQNRRQARPLPQLLAAEQLRVLDQFADFYIQGLNEAMKRNEIEDIWLGGLDLED